MDDPSTWALAFVFVRGFMRSYVGYFGYFRYAIGKEGRIELYAPAGLPTKSVFFSFFSRKVLCSWDRWLSVPEEEPQSDVLAILMRS